MRRTAAAVACAVLCAFGLTACHGGRHLSISPTSTNVPGCTSTPTLDCALEHLQANDILEVADGTYNQRVDVSDLPNGTSSEPIIVAAAANAHPVVHGVFWVGRAVYTTFSGINVQWGGTGSDAWLVRLYGGTNWRWTNSEVWGSQATSAIEVDEPTGEPMGTYTIDHNCIHDTAANHGTNQDHLIYVAEGTGTPLYRLVEHNILFNSPNGRGVKLGPGGTTGGPNGIVVQYNTMDNNLGPSNVQISQDSSSNVIQHNLMTRSGSYNITGFELSGTGNTASNNWGYQSDGVLQPGAGISDGGGNTFGNPSFDATGSCSGYHPGNASAQNYGAYAS
jgi:hypothetical protein